MPDSIYMTFWKRQNYSSRNISVVAKDLRGGWGENTNYQGHEGSFEGDRNIVYLVCGGGYTTVYICRNVIVFIVHLN